MPVNQQTSLTQALTDREDMLDFAEWAHYLYAKKVVVLVVALLCLIAAYTYTKTLVPEYQADSLIQVEPKQARMPGIEDVTVLLDRGARNLRDAAPREASIIKSRTVIGSAIDTLGLQTQVVLNYFPYFGEAAASQHPPGALVKAPFGLGAYAWGGERIKVDRFDVPRDAENVSRWQVEVLENREFIVFDSQENEVLRGREGVAASADYHGKKISVYISELLANPGLKFTITVVPHLFAINRLAAKVQVEERGQRTGILSVQLMGKDPVQTKKTLNAVVDSYVRYNLTQHSKEAKKMLAFLEEHLPKVKEREDVAEAALQEFRHKEGVVDLSSKTQRSMMVLGEIDKNLSEMELRRTELLNTYTENHPTITAMADKRKLLEAERIKLLEGFQSLSEKELKFIKLKRQLEVANEMHLAMVSRQNGLLLAKEGSSGNVSIIDYAEKPYVPLTKNKMVILVAGGFVGIMLGIFGVALGRILQRGVTDIKVLEAKVGVHVLASIMFSKLGANICANRKEEDGAALLALRDPSDIAVEGLRSLRTAVHFSLEEMQGNVVAISGPAPAVGKSFISSNFAAVYASSGRKVLLIDGDMRRGRLHECIGRLDAVPGLSEFTSGQASFEDVVQQVGDNLDFISRGGSVQHTSELLSSQKFDDLIDHGKAHYDLVVVDTPPVLFVTDASVIAKHAAQLLMVIKAGVSQMGEVEHAVAQFNKEGVEVSGIVMNMGKGGGSYGYNGYYGYSHKDKYKY